MRIPDEIIERIKSDISIVDAIESSGLVELRHNKGLCPFHNEKTPSFTVFPRTNTFNCFGCDAGGSIIDWVMQVKQINFHEAALGLAVEQGWMSADNTYYEDRPIYEARKRILKKPEERELPELPELSEGSNEMKLQLAELRGLNLATIIEAIERKFLGFADYSNATTVSPFGPTTKRHYWVVTDRAGVNAQLRRLDGKPCFSKIKAQTFKNAWAGWPLGITDLTGESILLAEGGPDFLAALQLCMNGFNASPVALLGANQNIHKASYPMFHGKTVYHAAHNDKAGAASVVRWEPQLRAAQANSYKPIVCKDVGTDLNDMIIEYGTEWTVNYFNHHAKISEDFKPNGN